MIIDIFDIAVIGSGGGTIIADTAMETGHKVALIEGSGWGGTCLNHGCIPTKIMVHAADVVRESEKAAKMGLQGVPLTADWPSLRTRVLEKIAEGKSLPDYYAAHANISCYFAMASFLPKQLHEGKEYFTLHLADNQGREGDILASQVVLANGGHTYVPEGQGFDEISYISAESFFAPEGFPAKAYDSLIIVGGGDIGVEFAHIFASFGTKVKLVQHNVRLVPKQDHEVSEKLLTLAKRDGVEVYLNRDTIMAGETASGKTLRIRHRETGEEEMLTAEEIMVSPGIRGNASSLNLSAVGLPATPHGWILTNEYLETAVPGIYALGDINGREQLRHKSNYEATILAWNLLQDGALHPKRRRKVSYEVVPRATFTALQIGSVGLTENQAREQGLDYRVGYLELSATAQGYARGYLPGDSDDGFAKVLVSNESKRIIGVHIMAPEASSLVMPYVYLMAAARQDSTFDGRVTEGETSAAGVYEAGTPPDSIDTIQWNMTIHPSLSELPAWAIGNWRVQETSGSSESKESRESENSRESRESS